jgi:NO-binding membrane sensor protein with MHYT domain
MGFYWITALVGALGVVLLLAVAVVALSHVRRLRHTMGRARARTSAAALPLRDRVAEIKARR